MSPDFIGIDRGADVTLSAIIPISSLNYRLDRIQSWAQKLNEANLELIFVHDIQDANFSHNLRADLEKICNVNIKFVEGSFRNPGAARNAGMSHATKEWVCFWDSDDFVLVTNFLKLIMEAEELNCEIALAPFILQHANGDTRDIPIGTGRPRDLAKFPGLWRFAFRREIVADQRFESLSMAEDQLFLLMCSIYRHKIFLGSTPVYKYYVGSPGQITSDLDRVQDLGTAREKIIALSRVLKGRDQELARRMLIRQTLTLVKNRKRLRQDSSIPKLIPTLLRKPDYLIQEILNILVGRLHE